MKLSIIIVSYNVNFFLEQCLHSIYNACTSIDTEIIVIDNNSNDNTVGYLENIFPAVRFISNKENIGFGKANNQGLAIATGEYILFLNPDTLISPTMLANTVSFLEKNPQAGATGVRMLDGLGNFAPESKRSFPSASVALYKLLGLDSLFPKSKIFGQYALGFLDAHTTHEVDILSGACMFFSKKVLDKIGGFDEVFFMYGEDIDLSYRAIVAGYKNYYLGEYPIIHFKGESSKKGSSTYIRNFYGAMNLFIKKHYQKKYFKKIFLELGIFISASLSKIKHQFFYRQKTSVLEKHKTFFLLGDTKAIESAEHILKRNNINYAIINKEMIADFLYQKMDIVFCLGDSFSMTDAIEIINNPGFHSHTLWHFYNSHSIIASVNKNINGYYIS